MMQRGKAGYRKVSALKHVFLLLALVMITMLSGCEKPELPAETLVPPTELPAMSADAESIPDDESIEVGRLNELVPQAIAVQEMLQGKNIFDGVEVIPFDRVGEIIPEPCYTELGSSLYLHTRKIFYYGDGGADFPELYNGFHYIDGEYDRPPHQIRQSMILAIYKESFLFFSNLFRISVDSKRFILDGAGSRYRYVFEASALCYWTEGRSWQYDGAGIYPDDLSFCIIFDEPSYLINHTMKQMVVLPGLQPKESTGFLYYGKQFLISRDHKYLVHILNSGEMIAYGLVDGSSRIIFIDEPVYESYDRLELLGWRSDTELFYQRGTRQCFVNTITGDSVYVGEYMFDITQSPDGKYIAYSRFHINEAMGWMASGEEHGQYLKLFDEEDYGSIVQNAETGEIVKFIPGEYVVGWFYD